MIHPTLLKRYEERLLPVDLRLVGDKKIASFPDNWTKKDFDVWDNKNSVALKTGDGLTVVDVDTKDLSLLDSDMAVFVKDRLEVKDTLIVETTHGYHIYLNTGNTPFKNGVRVSPYVDIRADGGCVFCYSNLKELGYTVLSDAPAMRAPDTILKMLKKKEKTGIAYVYNEDSLKVRTKNRPKANTALFSAVDSGDIVRVIRATGMSEEDDFLPGQMYVDFNRFAFILANEPSIRNEDVESILQVLVEEVLGFSWDSIQTQKALGQSMRNMIWSPEFFEPENEFNDISDAASFLDKFSLTDKELDDMEEDEVSIIENVLFKGQICVLVARPNAGKTLLAKQWSKEIAKEGYRLWYVYEDADLTGYKSMAMTGKEHGFRVIASFANVGTTPADILKGLVRLAETTEDLSKTVIIFDTLKKFTEVLEKKSLKEFFIMLRKITIKGGSILILAHANKYLDNNDNLVYEGTGDVLADIDAMYYMYDDGNKHAEVERYATIEKEKSRAFSAVKELSYQFNLEEYTAEKLDDPVDTRKMLAQNLVFYANKDKIEFVQQLISEGVTVQKDLIQALQDMHPLSRDKAHHFLVSLIDKCWQIQKSEGFTRTMNYELLEADELFEVEL